MCSIYITCEDFGMLLDKKIMETQVIQSLKPIFVDVIFVWYCGIFPLLGFMHMQQSADNTNP